MGFSFLTPLFALGAAAIVVPILVHLVHKERKETTPFPSLMFLRRTPYQHSRRQRIRDWLLFLLRALAVLLLVAAFARPVVERATPPAAPDGGGREVAVLLDQSFSMRYADRWTKAVEAAHAAVDAIGPDDRATVILFDDGAHSANEATADHVALNAAIDSARPTDAGTRYAPALAIARRILAGSRLTRRELVVVSDFQRSGWDLSEDSRMPAGTVVTPVDIASGDFRDHAVRSVELRRDLSSGRERIAVSARVANAGPAVHGLAARLDVAGRTLETKHVDIAADGGGIVTFDPIAVPDIPQRASVHLAADALTGDDVFHFVLQRTPSVPVLLVESATVAPDRDIFVQRALQIGDQPSFDLTVRRAGQFTSADIAGKRIVVLDDAGFPTGETGRRLEAFVRNGGGVLIALGEASGTSAWPAASRALLPWAVAEPRDRLADRGAVLGFIDRSHPALAIFGSAGSGDLSAARFFRYRPIATDSGVLARFDDGGVALAEHRLGRGRVLVWASSFDGLWNDLPRQPVFLPFIHELVQYTAGYRTRRDVYQVGDAVELGDAGRAAGDSAAAAPTQDAWVAVAPSGARERVGGEGEAGALIPREAGVYELRRVGAPGERPRLAAVNPPSRELDFARFDPTRLTNSVAPSPGTVASVGGVATPDAVTQERRQSLWWYLLLIVTGLLVAESVLADRLSRKRPAVS